MPYLCSDDIKNLERLKLKLGVPGCPAHYTSISPELLILHNMIAVRCVGAPLLLTPEPPKDQTQDSLLRDIRRGYQVVVNALLRLWADQQDEFVWSYVDYNASGSGEYLK